jgi:hypothetical protein
MIRRTLFCVLSLCLLSASAAARRDPLTDAEIDQLRDTAQDPLERLKLYIEFARARLAKLELLRSDPKVTDKAHATRAALQDFIDVYDEFDENVDTFADRKEDLRKPLRAVIEADNEFQARLRAIKTAAQTNTAETRVYEFVLGDALDAVDRGTQDHRQLQTEQAEYWKHHKPPKPMEQQKSSVKGFRAEL